MSSDLPQNLQRLHSAEEHLRQKAQVFLAGDARLQLHLAVTEAAMELADVLRQCSTSDEDLKVVQMLGMRTFNAFGAALKLALSGYHQNSALVLRDVLETTFLLDLFRGDGALIERWRSAQKKDRMKDFAPVKVREALDARDGFTSKKRFEMYEMFSELAGHPNMNSHLMMRPEKKVATQSLDPSWSSRRYKLAFLKWVGSHFRSGKTLMHSFRQNGALRHGLLFGS